MTPAEKSVRAIRRVLVIFPGALGDLICLMPAIAAISRRHPGASVELMARFELARLVAGRTVVARAHSIDGREVGALFTDQGAVLARGFFGFFGGFEHIYSFFASDDSRFRARLVAASGGVVSFHPFRPGGDGHVAAGYLRAIGEADSPIEPRIEPTADDLAAAAHVIAEAKCGGANLIVIFPGSGSPGKNWPVEKFAALASMVAGRASVAPEYGGCGDSKPVPASLARSCPEARSQLPSRCSGRQDDKLSSVAVVLGPAEAGLETIFRDSGVPVLTDLDLATVAAVARLASAFVGNDSGVSHLAAAVGASGVVIFGPTDPARWRPLSARGRIEVFRREPIDSIEVREVAGALSKFG